MTVPFGSSNDVGTSSPRFITADPIFDISIIGPGTPIGGPGIATLDSPGAEKFTKIEGEKITPVKMMPPEIEMSEEQRGRLTNYLWNEMQLCRAERSSQVSKFARLKLKYRTKFPEFPKNFPIPNSSQITIPIIKTAVDTQTSRLHQTVMAASPMASVRTKDPVFQDFSEGWEQFLHLYSEEKFEIEDVLDTAITEAIKLGTSVVECTRLLKRRKEVDFDALAGRYNQSTRETYNGPILYNVPIEDFWIRPLYQDVQKAPWCGKELRLAWSTIKDWALSGDLNPDYIDKIWRLPENPGLVPETVRQDATIEQAPPSSWDEYQIHELHVRWDVDGDGVDEEIIVYFHENSRTILRVKFNTFRKNRRPFIVFRYKKIEYRFYGEGVAEMLEQLQEEISTMHNHRIDNSVIAALKLILTSKSIAGLRPGDPVWPGKIVKTQNAKQDVEVLSLGEIYPSTIQAESQALGYARELSGIGEVATGQAQPVSRTTAAAQLSLLEELNRRSDKTLKGFRRSIREIFNQTTDLFNQTGTGGLAEKWFGTEKGMMIETYITLPPEHLYSKIKIQITSTKATVNREVEMQTNIAVMNLIIQNGQQLLSLVQGIVPQALPIVARLLIESIRPVYKKVLQYADAPDPDSAVKILAFVESILPSPENMGGMEQQAQLNSAANSGGAPTGGGGRTNGNGAGSAPKSGGAPGLDDLMQAIAGARGGQPGVVAKR